MKMPYEIKIRNCNELFDVSDAITILRTWMEERDQRSKLNGHLYFTLRSKFNVRETNTGSIIITKLH